MPRAAPLAPDCEAVLARRLEQRIVPGLERMHRVLAALGHPEEGLRTALIVGTNGKGSTAALLASILGAHGLRVGLYTSPHLVRVEERIRVDGHPIAPARLHARLAFLDRFPELSYFEALTVAAILEFAEQSVAIAVLEAGLGGRWDATNAVAPAVSLLTNVGTDHLRWLGPTRRHIAAEKAAALRGQEAIVGAWDAEVEGVIRERASAPVTLARHWAQVEASRATGRRRQVRFAVEGVRGQAPLPLAGGHQHANLTLALAGAAALARHRCIPPLRGAAVAQGIASVRWPGRLDLREFRGRRLLLDGAHNREAVAALVAYLEDNLPGPVDLLFSCLADKPLVAMAAALEPFARRVTVVALDTPRATPLAELAAAFPGCRTADTVDAALAATATDATTLVTGSLRLVGEVLRRLEASHG